MTHLAWPKKRRSSSDSGMTTIELITAMSISSVLGIMALYVFLSLNSATTSTIEQSSSATEARVILDSWNTLLQVAETPLRTNGDVHAFEKVTASQVTFYASINNRTGTNVESLPTKVNLISAGGEVIEERYTPTSMGWPASPTVRRILATGASATFAAVDSTGALVGSTGAGYNQLCRTIGGSTYAGVCSSAGCLPNPELVTTPVLSCSGVRGANEALGKIANVRITLNVTDSTGETHVYEGVNVGVTS